jgi:hypothetical protein
MKAEKLSSDVSAAATRSPLLRCDNQPARSDPRVTFSDVQLPQSAGRLECWLEVVPGSVETRTATFRLIKYFVVVTVRSL